MIRKGVKHRPPQKAIILKRGTAFGKGDQFWQPKVVWGDHIWQLKVVCADHSWLQKVIPGQLFGRTTSGMTGLDLAIANAATSHELQCEEERAMEALP